MKIIFCLLVLTSFKSFSQDSLQSSQNADSVFLKSSWSGTVHIPDEVPVLIEFSKDTLFFYINGELVETMNYVKKGTTFQLKKLYGVSPCDETPAVYDLLLVEEKKKLIFKAVKDACQQRALGLGNNNEFTRL